MFFSCFILWMAQYTKFHKQTRQAYNIHYQKYYSKQTHHCLPKADLCICVADTHIFHNHIQCINIAQTWPNLMYDQIKEFCFFFFFLFIYSSSTNRIHLPMITWDCDSRFPAATKGLWLFRDRFVVRCSYSSLPAHMLKVIQKLIIITIQCFEYLRRCFNTPKLMKVFICRRRWLSPKYNQQNLHKSIHAFAFN